MKYRDGCSPGPMKSESGANGARQNRLLTEWLGAIMHGGRIQVENIMDDQKGVDVQRRLNWVRVIIENHVLLTRPQCYRIPCYRMTTLLTCHAGQLLKVLRISQPYLTRLRWSFPI